MKLIFWQDHITATRNYYLTIEDVDLITAALPQSPLRETRLGDEDTVSGKLRILALVAQLIEQGHANKPSR